MKIFCSQCGAKIGEKDILGIGTFERNIGKYAGTTFVTFECSSCHRKEYQLLSQNPFQKKKPTEVSAHPELTPEEILLSQRETIIAADDIIDFYRQLKRVSTIKEFLALSATQRKDLTEDQGLLIKDPKDVYNIFTKYNDIDKKRLMILVVDAENHLLNWEVRGEGTKHPISFEPNIIFRMPLILKGEAALILAHNLASADQKPSKKDVLRIKRLVKAGEILGIDLLDNVVIHKGGYFSFDDLNLL